MSYKIMKNLINIDKNKDILHNNSGIRGNNHSYSLQRIVPFLLLFFLLSSPLPTQAGNNLNRTEQLESEASDHYEQKRDQLNSIYDRAISNMVDNPENVLQGKSLGEWVYFHFYSAYHAVRDIALFAGSMSILVGSIGCFITRRNKILFKKTLVILVIAVPLLLIAFVFGVGAVI